MGQRTAGDLMFEAYVASCGLDVPEHEPDLGLLRRPDYLLNVNGQTCLCEVKEFAPTTNSIPGAGTWPLTTVLKPIRRQVHEGARQLRAAAGLGHAFVVVLTNPHGAPVILGEQEFIWALEGDPVVRVPVGQYGSEEPVHTVGRNVELRHDHPYLTAVVHLRQSESNEHSATAFIPSSPLKE